MPNKEEKRPNTDRQADRKQRERRNEGTDTRKKQGRTPGKGNRGRNG